MRLATRAIIHTDEGILLLKRRNGLYINYWDLPGGTKDQGDITLEHCIIRETREETGLNIIPVRYSVIFSDRYRIHYYEALCISGQFKVNTEEFFITQRNFFCYREIKKLPLAFEDNRNIILGYCSDLF